MSNPMTRQEQLEELIRECTFEPTPEMVAKTAQAIEDFYRNKIPEITGETSDGYHTFNELYRYRLLYNAAFFNSMKDNPVWGFGEHKSMKHSDGEDCFGGGWFIVMATLPTGQISNHYELKDWDLFNIPEKELADEWDGHTPQDVEKRLTQYITAQFNSKGGSDE